MAKDWSQHTPQSQGPNKWTQKPLQSMRHTWDAIQSGREDGDCTRLLMTFIKISWVSKNIELYDKLLVRVHLCLARLVSRVVLVHTGETFLNQMSHEKLWTREMPAIHQNKNIFASMRLFNCVNNPYGGLLALHAGKGRRYAHFLFVKIRLLLWTLLCDHSACSFTNEKFTHGITSH